MLSAYLFDQRRGKDVPRWRELLRDLDESQTLWLDLSGPSIEETAEVRDALRLELNTDRLDDNRAKATLEQKLDYIRVTAVAAAESERTPRETVVVDCFVGKNWVVTAHNREVPVIEEFRTRASGAGEIGALDAPSFLATLLEWVVSSYLRALEEIETTLEKFDVNVLRSPRRDTEKQIAILIEERRRIGDLRRALVPHREVFAALSHSEFDPISTEASAIRFTELTSKVDAALDSARDAKESVFGSFDVLLARTGHRTNEIMKVLTLASILLLPGALIAGLMGMNVTFKTDQFLDSPIFVISIAFIGITAILTLAIARARRWI